jgi:hypothetical protein
VAVNHSCPEKDSNAKSTDVLNTQVQHSISYRGVDGPRGIINTKGSTRQTISYPLAGASLRKLQYKGSSTEQAPILDPQIHYNQRQDDQMQH